MKHGSYRTAMHVLAFAIALFMLLAIPGRVTLADDEQPQAAEGVIYQDFADDPEPYILDIAPHIVSASIGVDFGGTKSAHAFVCVGFTAGYKSVVVLDEYYHDNVKDGRLSPAQLDEAFVAFVREQKSKYQITGIYCDSAEQTLIQGFQIAALKARISAPICNAIKGEINERIAFYNSDLTL